ncbi:MAG TPA: hypothetical protein VGN57_07990 [Pirellulaceae bacterium]|jgi:hypothetical protein|nr:hypothetical protein [Pirellulaceae bacterium]
MTVRRNALLCMLVAVSLAPVLSKRAIAQEAVADPALPPFIFHREGADSSEAAATTLFRACAMRSPAHFVQHLNLGVCDGPIDTLQTFAEFLHTAEFRHGEDSFTVYDLPRQINSKQPNSAIATQEFDRGDKQVAALQFQAVSTHYGEKFESVDVVGKSYDGLEYRMRIVTALVRGRWYAIPRCRSSKSFYEIADAMPLPSPEAKETE